MIRIPDFIELGVDLPHKNVIAIICYEDYAQALEGPLAVEVEAMEAYARCAGVSTEIARYIRDELGIRLWRTITGRIRSRGSRYCTKWELANLAVMAA